MFINIFALVCLAVVVVLLTHLVVRGIELLAAAGTLSSKAKGQFLGYATSIPELVGTVGTAGYGLLGAGLWNIGASNIINCTLMAVASIYYRRVGALMQRKFIDEMAFALGALIVPIVLFKQGAWAQSPWTAVGLFGFFVSYIYIDRKLNPEPPPSFAQAAHVGPPPDKTQALLFILAGVGGIVTTGRFLGQVAEVVVRDIGVPEWGVGWILGFITSLPEMTAFFAIYASAKKAGFTETDDTDCQENLDSLAASNMSNLGLIYPIGVAVFLLVGRS